MASSSSGMSSSSSSTFPIETQENGIMDQIAQQAAAYASDLYNWAGSTFAQTSAITNEAVNNFFNVSSNMNQLSGNLTNQYNNLFAPENAQLVADANSYASPARMAVDMGMAGATQAQAGNAALANSEEALRSYGIDPSAGRYAALDQASRVQNAANVAGAENLQRMQDIQTGQNLRSQAVQIGAQLPAAIANVNNTAIQANTGASNAELANANTGANLYSVPDKYLSTGMQVKLPFSGSQGSSFSSNSSSNEGGGGSGSGSGGGGSGGGGGGSSGSGGGGSTDQQDAMGNTAAMGNDGSLGGGLGPGGSQPDAGILNVPDSGAQNMTDVPDDSWAGGGGDGGGDFARGGAVMMRHATQTPVLAEHDYAHGGRVPMRRLSNGYLAPNYAEGGQVDPSLSPSQGAITDDVPMQTPAGPGHLNANEFVVPQDVALWKGQEFFQKLIDQSRKARAMGSAKPTVSRG